MRKEEAQAVGWLARKVYEGDAGCIPALTEYLLSLLLESKHAAFAGTPEFQNLIAYRVRRYLYDRMIVRKGRRTWKSEEELGRIIVGWAFRKVEEVKARARAELRGKRSTREGCQEETYRKAVECAKDILSHSYGYDPRVVSLDEPASDEKKRTRYDFFASPVPTPEEVLLTKEELQEVRV